MRTFTRNFIFLMNYSMFLFALITGKIPILQFRYSFDFFGFAFLFLTIPSENSGLKMVIIGFGFAFNIISAGTIHHSDRR